jgi:uncharacterized protein YndB with AHSA1/START domain
MPEAPIGKHQHLLQHARPGYPTVVALTQATVQAPPDRVFAVLSDGWWYSDWVVGTAHIRDVDPDWPAVGSQLHHKAGPWPISLADSSTVVVVEQDRRLRLHAGLWPLGEAVVDIRLEPVDGGRTRVLMYENFERGPLLGLRNKLNDLLLHRRNVEALRRLADLAERAQTRHGSPR